MRYVYAMTDKLVEFPLAKLRPNPDNPRRLMGDVGELAETLEQQGMIEPVVARLVAGEDPYIVAGHRRCLAAKKLGWKTVPTILRVMSRPDALAQMVIENHQREDVTPMELASGYKGLMEMGLSADDVSKRVGASKAGVYAHLQLLTLPEAVQQAVGAGRLAADAARHLAGLEGERLQLAAFSEAMKLSKNGEPPPSRAVAKMVQTRFKTSSKKGQTKHQREAKELGAEVAIRRRVLERLISRAGESTLTKPHLDDTLLRLMATAHAESGSDSARVVFQRLGVHPGRVNKVSGAQLRRLVFELAVAQWVGLEGAEFNTGARVTAKTCGQSLADLERAVVAETNAEALFKA